MARIRKRVELNEENIKWYEETYPKGSLSWLCDLALQKFREAHTISPSDYMEIGIVELMREMEEE
jgi:hypothetical protein